MSKIKISLKRPPPVKNLWFLPDISEYKTLIQFSYSDEQLCKLLNSKFGSLSDSSVRNMLSSQGIKRSDFKSKYLRPLFKALGPDRRREFRILCKSVFSKYPIQVRNTAEWLAAVYPLPDDNLLKRFINDRSNAFLHEHELSRHGREFNDTREELDHIFEFYSKNTIIRSSLLGILKSQEFHRLYEDSTSLESLPANTKNGFIRYATGLRQDFYLGLVSTQSEAPIFLNEVFPRFIVDCDKDVQASMVSSVLEWIRCELRYNTLTSFELYIAAPPPNSARADYGIDYAKDKMKLWRKSSCNCRCAGRSGCKHRGISVDSIELVCERLKAHDKWLKNIDMVNLLTHAKMLDNLQANLICLASKDDDDERHFSRLVKDEFRRNVDRFGSYIDRYGV